jgi:hypothetical protein
MKKKLNLEEISRMRYMGTVTWVLRKITGVQEDTGPITWNTESHDKPACVRSVF